MAVLAFQMPDKVVMEKADDFHGIFEFKPLEPGYGVTVGNALRRVLLSSLEGYAIIGIKMGSVLHEFSTVEGVVEDVSEIILNLKMLRLKKLVEDESSQKITIQLSGKSELTGKDITDATNEFEVLNPELVICHMDESVELELRTFHRQRTWIRSCRRKSSSREFFYLYSNRCYLYANQKRNV